VLTQNRLKTLLLGLAVIIITFTIFVVLPTQLPPAKSISCNKVIWACSKRGAPIKYHTVIWDEPIWPVTQTPLGKIRYLPPVGKLLVEEDPDNNEKITVSGYLMYATKEEPEDDSLQMSVISPKGGLSRRTIRLEVECFYGEESTIEEAELTTDMDGFFSTDIEFEETPDCYTIYAGYAYETIVPQNPELPVEIYFNCGAFYTNCKGVEWGEGAPESQWWFWLIIVVVVLGSGYLCYWYYRRRRRRPTIKVPEAGMEAEIEEGLPPEEGEEKEGYAGGDIVRIEIHFPQIEDSFPDVWGSGEPLTVLLRLKDRNGDAIPSQNAEIDWGDRETVQANADGEGQIRLEHVYNIKGEYTISASYTDKDTGKRISSWRKIRIVDYREEMVRLFNEMLETLNLRDIHIDPEMTAREIEVLLAERLEGVPGGTIRRIVARFEEANYSLHPVARSSYESMYLSITEVLKNAG
jgi:hypothetical protein